MQDFLLTLNGMLYVINGELFGKRMRFDNELEGIKCLVGQSGRRKFRCNFLLMFKDNNFPVKISGLVKVVGSYDSNALYLSTSWTN
jgi:hypothetical protein